VPTFAEIGLPRVTTAHYWISVFAPGGTPAPVVEALNTEIRRITKSAEYRPLIERQGLVPSDLTAGELGERVRKDLAYWHSTVKPLGIKAD
jgi:tripartite-type tricarboxylate transporter receptor subunit TctC